MTDMVERVARASFAFWKQQNSRVADFEDMNPDELEFAMAHARAMIEEMQEPTAEMVKAGTISWDPMDGGPIRPMFEPTKPYQAMMKAALIRNESET